LPDGDLLRDISTHHGVGNWLHAVYICTVYIGGCCRCHTEMADTILDMADTADTTDTADTDDIGSYVQHY